MYYASIPALVIERTLVAKQQTTRRHRTNPDSVQYVTSPLRQRIQPPVVHLTNSAEKKKKVKSSVGSISWPWAWVGNAAPYTDTLVKRK